MIQPNGPSSDNLYLAQQRQNQSYAEAITISQTTWAQMEVDALFHAGNQSRLHGMFPQPFAYSQRQIALNRIRKVVSTISGYQSRNRKSIVGIPIENADQLTADQYTKIFFWISQQEDLLDTISDCVESSLITGLSCLQLWNDYRLDPVSGNLRFTKRDYNEIIMDPFFKKPDLSDCNYMWLRSYLTQEEARSLLPDFDEEMLTPDFYTPRTAMDGRFEYTPQSRLSQGINNLVAYDEYYYRSYRKAKLLVDKETGETKEWTGKSDEQLKLYLEAYPVLKVIEQDRPTTNLTISIQNRAVWDGRNPMGIDAYPIVPFFTYYQPEISDYATRIQGVVRGLRDAQWLYNRRKVIELDILESVLNSGYKFKENALVNPQDAFKTGQGRPLVLKKGAQMTDVERIESPVLPPSTLDVSRILADEIPQIAGMSDELMGMSDNVQAGILEQLRTSAGLTSLNRIFSKWDLAHKILGRLMLSFVQNNFVPGKVAKILGEDPAPQFYDKAFGRYDVAVQEGLNTETQKQMQFAQLVQLRSMNVQITDEQLLNAAPIQNKTEIIEGMLQNQQMSSEIEMQKLELEMQLQQAQIQLAQARAVADQGLGIERVSRIKENQALAVERRAEAAKDIQESHLAAAKTLRELEGVDLANLEKMLQLAQIVKAQKDQSEAKEAMEAQAAQGMQQEQQMPQMEAQAAQGMQQEQQMPQMGLSQQLQGLQAGGS